jgi:hypothetical protein
MKSCFCHISASVKKIFYNYMYVHPFKKWGYHGKGGGEGGKGKKDMAKLGFKNCALYPDDSLGSGTNEQFDDIYGYVFKILGLKVSIPCSACLHGPLVASVYQYKIKYYMYYALVICISKAQMSVNFKW